MGRCKQRDKFETWLTRDMMPIAELHMINSCSESKASYTREAVLAGLPALNLAWDMRINELAMALNRLSRSVDARADEDVAAVLPVVERLLKDLQKSQAAHRRAKKGRRS